MNKLEAAPSLTELAYSSLKRSLLNGTLGKQGRFTEATLAMTLGTSKSPIREALNRLGAEGLICIEPRRGAYVRQFSLKEVQDLYDLRVVLEMRSVADAIVTTALLEQLAASVERTRRYVSIGEKLKHIDEDLRFHSLIAGAAGNRELASVFENIQQKSLLCRSRSYELSASTAPFAHAKIYETLKVGDKAAATAAMREHIVYVRDRLVASLQQP
jgi:DNA-binding GntR family transcriptional regulator